MDQQFRNKRDKFIEEAIKALEEVCQKSGYKCASKETLSLLVQRYIKKYKPTKFPKRRRKKTSSLIIIRGGKNGKNE